MTEQASGEKQKLIVCEELVKIYRTDDSKVMALQGLELEIRQGEMLALIGKSGSGKSTLLNMIGGLETPSAGRLYVEGRDLAAYSAKEMEYYRKKKIGFVWQKSARNLMPYLTARQNVEMPLCFSHIPGHEQKRRAMDLLREVGLEQHAERFPHQLSGGEQQRVAIARALVNQPTILLADEPTGNLDSKTSQDVLSLLKVTGQKFSQTIVMITHNEAIAQLADRIIHLEDGRVVK